MKKLFLVCAVAGVCSVSTIASGSDRAVVTAWTGISNSIARIASSATMQDIASMVKSAPVFASNSDRQASKSTVLLPDSGTKSDQACPVCPEPPCW